VKAARLNTRFHISGLALTIAVWREAAIRFEREVDKTTWEGVAVNKTELIEHIARQADISKAAAGRALEAIVGAFVRP